MSQPGSRRPYVPGRWTLKSILLLVCCLRLCCVPSFAAVQSDDETQLRTLAERFFAAYQKRDLDGLMSLISPSDELKEWV